MASGFAPAAARESSTSAGRCAIAGSRGATNGMMSVTNADAITALHTPAAVSRRQRNTIRIDAPKGTFINSSSCTIENALVIIVADMMLVASDTTIAQRPTVTAPRSERFGQT